MRDDRDRVHDNRDGAMGSRSVGRSNRSNWAREALLASELCYRLHRCSGDKKEQAMTCTGVLLRRVVLIAAVWWFSVERPMHVRAADRLDDSVAAFKGKVGRREIVDQLTIALRSFGLPLKEGSYIRASVILTKLREDTGTPEIDTLDCINSSDFQSSAISFDDAAAICAAPLPALPPPPTFTTRSKD